jgi:serine/threonine-protein kinase
MGETASQEGLLGAGSRVGSYEVKEMIAAGGFGSVYRVEHVVLGRAAALKVLHADLAGVREQVLRFEREAQAVNRIRHPNIVDIYEFGTLADGRPYFVMELLDGVNLDDALEARGALEPEAALAILEPLCNALGAAHELGIVHRDVKAKNIVLGPDGDRRRRAVLLDFGIAKLIDQPGTTLTRTGHRVGTPACMAPEQIAGGEIGPFTDVYALGALAFHMLTGQPPFADLGATVVCNLQLYTRQPLVANLVPVPEAVSAAVAHAMSLEPGDRPARAYAFIAERAAAVRGPATAVGAHSTPAFGLHVEVGIDEAALANADEALLADLDAIVPAAARTLAAAGWLLALDAGSAALFVLPVADAPSAADREAAAAVACALHETLTSGPARHRHVRVTLCLHLDSALVAEGRVCGGELLRLATWVPGTDLGGAFASLAVVDDSLPTARGPAPPGFVRLG